MSRPLGRAPLALVIAVVASLAGCGLDRPARTDGVSDARTIAEADGPGLAGDAVAGVGAAEPSTATPDAGGREPDRAPDTTGMTDAQPDAAEPEVAVPEVAEPEAPAAAPTPAGTPASAAPAGDPPPVEGDAQGVVVTAGASAQPGTEPSAAPLAATPADGPLRVATDGSGDHTTIAAAVTALTGGREIHVAPGVYREALVFDRRVTLVGEGGKVIIEGGAEPAVTLDTKTQVVLRGVTLLSGTAAASLGTGQLVLEECRLEARPAGVALRSTEPVSQLIARRCLIDAGRGTALQLDPGTTGELVDCTFAWESDNETPLVRGDEAPALIVRGARLAWRLQAGSQLLPDVLAGELSGDGRPALMVEPRRDVWPAWARTGVTHFETIASAVAAAGVNQRIDVAPGRYEEQVGLRQATHLRALGEPGAVVLAASGAPCLWQNATSRSTVSGFVLEGDVAEKTATVQVNGGRVDLLRCRIDNPAGNAVIATSTHAACEVVLEGCELTSGRTGIYITGGTTSVNVIGGRLVAQTQGVLALDGGRARLEGVELQAGKVGIEVWGTVSQVELVGGRVVSTPQVLLHAKGARRSQILATDVDTSAAAVTDG